MEPEMTCTSNDTTEKMKLYMAMELSQKEWKLGFRMEGGSGSHEPDTTDGGMTSPRPGFG